MSLEGVKEVEYTVASELIYIPPFHVVVCLALY